MLAQRRGARTCNKRLAPFFCRRRNTENRRQASAVITNTTGTVVSSIESKRDKGSNMVIDLSSQPRGIYFVKLYSNDQLINTFKVVKIE